MTVKHIPEGQDFEHPADFGFTGSASKNTTALSERGAPEAAIHGVAPGHQPAEHEAHALSAGHGGDNYAGGGHVHPHGHRVVRVEHHHDGAVTHHHAHGGYTHHHADGHVTHHDAHGGEVHHDMAMGGSHLHPHGHNVVHTEHHHDGTKIEHHAHGGRTVHHPDGRVTHHDAHGGHMASGHHGGHDHGEGTYLQEKRLATSAVHQHEDQEHHGEHSDIELARGGMPRLPRGMKPRMAVDHSPINRPPKPPRENRTPKNSMPGDNMPYGVQPSDEAGEDSTGGDGIPQLHRGGHHR